MRSAFLVLFMLLWAMQASAGSTPGSSYVDHHGRVKAVSGTAQMQIDSWAYWVVPVEASGKCRATVYAQGTYRADTLSIGGWVPVGYFTGTTSFPALSGAVALHAQGPVTVYSIEVD